MIGTRGCLLALVLAASAAHADDGAKKNSGASDAAKKKAANDAFGDLFGAPAETGGDLDSLRAASKGVTKGDSSGALKPKAAKIRDGVDVQFPSVFAAERIRLDRKLGCVPATKSMVRIKEFRFSQLPASTPAFSVCLRMESDVGRSMRMSVSFVDPRMKQVAHADSVADFTGKDAIDHILDWPDLNLAVPGVYSYVIDLDGKRVAKVPVFEVKVGEAP